MQRVIELIQEHPLLKYSDYKLDVDGVIIKRNDTIIKIEETELYGNRCFWMLLYRGEIGITWVWLNIIPKKPLTKISPMDVINSLDLYLKDEENYNKKIDLANEKVILNLYTNISFYKFSFKNKIKQIESALELDFSNEFMRKQLFDIKLLKKNNPYERYFYWHVFSDLMITENNFPNIIEEGEIIC